MNERIRILNMVGEGKITAEEAEKLLDALERRCAGEQETIELKDKRGRKSKKFRVKIDPGDSGGKTKVNVGIPLSMVRAFGPFITKNMPKEAMEEMGRCGVDLKRILEELDTLAEEGGDEDIVNIHTDGEDPSKIRIFFE
jgi:hypothetical protein